MKSAVQKPVVLIMEAVWKVPYLIASPIDIPIFIIRSVFIIRAAPKSSNM